MVQVSKLMSCPFYGHDDFWFHNTMFYFLMSKYKIKITNVKMSWFLYFYYCGLLGSRHLKSQISKLPLFASPLPPVNSISFAMCIVRTSSLWAFKVHSTLRVIRSQIVIIFSQAVSMIFLYGSTMTYFTRPVK